MIDMPKQAETKHLKQFGCCSFIFCFDSKSLMFWIIVFLTVTVIFTAEHPVAAQLNFFTTLIINLLASVTVLLRRESASRMLCCQVTFSCKNN